MPRPDPIDTAALRELERDLDRFATDLRVEDFRCWTKNALYERAGELLGKARATLPLCAEVEALRSTKDALIMQARIWAGEARAQKATVDEVGALLGGIPDWGPIAEKVSAALADLEALREREKFVAQELKGVGQQARELKDQLSQARRERDENERKLNKFDVARQNAEAERDEARAQVAKLKTRLSSMHGQHRQVDDAQKHAIAKLTEERDEARKDLGEEQNMHGLLHADHLIVKGKLAALEKVRAAAEAYRESMSHTVPGGRAHALDAALEESR